MYNRFYFNVFFLLSILLCFSCTKSLYIQRKNKIEDKDLKVYNKPGGFVLLKGGKDKEVCYFDETVVMVNKDGSPLSVFASADFNPLTLQDSLQQQLFLVKSAVLDFSLIKPKKDEVAKETNQVEPLLLMPLWLEKLNNLQFIRLEHLKVNNLLLLKNAPLKHIIFKNVVIEEKIHFVAQLAQLKTLEYIVADSIFSREEVSFLQEKIPNIVLLLETEYYQKVEEGEIKL